MKKLLMLSSVFILALSLAGCKEEEIIEEDPVCTDTQTLIDGVCVDDVVEDTYEIAMITDAGEIDDKSFNQGTWEGIVEFAEANELTYKYYKPLEISDNAYLNAIELAISGGAEVVVTPGFLFEVAIYQAQTLYPDVKFILIDGQPHAGDWATYETKENTLSIMFNEHESGFLAGYAAVKEGFTELGFTGGMAVPAVVKFGVGFIAGSFYAADEMDVDINFGTDRYHYFGSFGPDALFKDLASSWYVLGTEVIFSAAGGAGLSVMAAAAENGAVMIGVDIDQAEDSPTVLTSAMKQLGVAVQQGLQAYLDDTFVGGISEYKGVQNDGVALPMATSRFSVFLQADYDAIYALLVAETVVVPANYAELVTFLAAIDATFVYPSELIVTGSE